MDHESAPGPDAPAEPRTRLRWARRVSVAGLVISLSTHALVALFAAFVVVRFGGGGSGGDQEVVDFAVMTSVELSTEITDALTTDTTLAPELDDSATESLDELELDGDATLDTLTERTLDADLSLGGGDLSDGELFPGLGGGSGGGTSFFGVEAQGSRFAYIVDVSSSMNTNGRIDRTKSELLRSLQTLADTSEFVIVVYSNAHVPLGGQMRWTRSNPSSKEIFAARIREIATGGGTYPLSAFEAVLGMRATPDAVFFMTDGEIPDDVPNAVRGMNARRGIPVHCILVGEVSPSAVRREEARRKLQQISRQSGGRFNHVDD